MAEISLICDLKDNDCDDDIRLLRTATSRQADTSSADAVAILNHGFVISTIRSGNFHNWQAALLLISFTQNGFFVLSSLNREKSRSQV